MKNIIPITFWYKVEVGMTPKGQETTVHTPIKEGTRALDLILL